MRIRLRSSGVAIVVAVSGEVDLCTAPRLAQALDQASRQRRQVVVDLEKVAFMDCAGLRVLLRASDQIRSDGGRFYVTPGSRQVRKLFMLTDADRLLRFVPPATASIEAAA